MDWHSIVYYIRHDLLYYRGRREVIFGFISIWFATATLLILFALASTVETIVERSLEEARPMMGTLRVHSLSSATLTDDQQTFLKTLVTKGSDVENISWVTEDFTNGFDIWPTLPVKGITQTEQKKLLLRAFAIAPDDPMLNPDFGIRYWGKEGKFSTDPNQRHFEIILNKRILGDEKGLNISAEKLEAIKSGQTLYLNIQFLRTLASHDPQIKDYFRAFESRQIPVSGIIDQPDKEYPDIWFHHDVAKAYYYSQRYDWHPSYGLQFVDATGQPLFPEFKIVKENSRFMFHYDNDGFQKLLKRGDYITLPTAPDRFSKDLEYSQAIIWLRYYKDPQSRQRVMCAIKQKPEEKAFCEQLKITADPQGKNLSVKPFNFGLTEALNRITPTINFFVIASSIIVMLLSFFNVALFGMGYVWRKRLDIGILRTFAMPSLEVGRLYLLQILMVSFAGLVTGIIIAVALSFTLLQPIANWAVGYIIPPFSEAAQIAEIPLTITGSGLIKTIGIILFASLLGALIPTRQATRVDPIEQLRSQL
ncbi:FtsX-like permease family protein [Candidatus Parabeggiatoa sp. HSG14]|uniref:ABC transporter permease n=1 Tax=Candidatus Parabeggiatoa sp. HSG14 TaxID=3055593 RepID=UPI0025A8783A|nr:FtsX-like permease family protein [Thiotrichales bacterium HSG14]